jgi:hypothetical protein
MSDESLDYRWLTYSRTVERSRVPGFDRLRNGIDKLLMFDHVVTKRALLDVAVLLALRLGTALSMAGQTFPTPTAGLPNTKLDRRSHSRWTEHSTEDCHLVTVSI